MLSDSQNYTVFALCFDVLVKYMQLLALQLKSYDLFTERDPLVGNFVMHILEVQDDRLCGQVVRVSGYKSRGTGFLSRLFQIF
jgi:hypothetical protein